MKIFKYLKLYTTKYSVVLIINAESSQLGRKDIIKIERDKCEEIDYTVLGLLSPSITINEIKNEKIIRKIRPTLPKKVENIIVCNNPNCITKVEKYVPQSFSLVNAEKGTYKCDYCDHITKLSDM